MNDSDPYATIGELYDLEHDEFTADLDLYLQSAAVVGGPVLELGCGSGRIAIPLAEAGHAVTGLDSSEAMLERARTRTPPGRVHQRLTWFRGDMCTAAAAPGGPFGLVIVALNGLLHLPDSASQREVLAAAQRVLDPRGQLLIDVLNPSPQRLLEFDGSVVHEGHWFLDDGRRVDKLSARRLSTAEQLIHTELWYDVTDAEGAIRRTAASFDQRYLTRAELELMLEITGFPVWQLYGSYDLDPFTDDSDRILIAAERTAP